MGERTQLMVKLNDKQGTTKFSTGKYAVLYPCKLWQLEPEGSKLISPMSLDWGSWLGY